MAVGTVSKEELDNQRLFIRRVCAVIHVFDHKPLAYTHSYGCQQNVSDSEKLDGMLEKMGFGFTNTPDNADLVLYNTCAVRENAEDRVFGTFNCSKNPNSISASRLTEADFFMPLSLTATFIDSKRFENFVTTCCLVSLTEVKRFFSHSGILFDSSVKSFLYHFQVSGFSHVLIDLIPNSIT